MPTMKLTKEVIDKINQFGIDIEELVLLYKRHFDLVDWDFHYFPASENNLKRLGYLSPEDKLTAAGEMVLFDCIEEVKEEAPSFNDADTDKAFELFWKTFPATDEYQSWAPTRKLRYNKAATKEEYMKALVGMADTASIQKALEADITWKIRTAGRDNPFKYFKNSVNWLKTKHYETLLDELTTGSIKTETEVTHGKGLL